MGYEAIPAELRLLKQWITWSYVDIGTSKPTKIPYNPITGRKANVTDPNTWCSFDDAIMRINNYSGLGFVFSVDDSYSGIDLDDSKDDEVAVDRQLTLFKSFDSYSEISPSGKGLHIIVKGTVPSGAKKNGIEVYSSGRYFTMTGNVHHDVPIAERQSLLLDLYKALKPNESNINIQYTDQAEKYTDEQIIEQCKSASNGAKFSYLFAGDWRRFNYPSQSEADYAIIDIIAFYTQNRNQIARIFHQSALGSRAKAKLQYYLNGMINSSFDKQLPPVNFDGFKEAVERKIENDEQSARMEQSVRLVCSNGENKKDNQDITDYDNRRRFSHSQSAGYEGKSNGSTGYFSMGSPPGLIGEIAHFIYQSAPRPILECALAGAFGLMAGICGRAYNISGTGLNQYILMLAKTGTGKEGMAMGIDRLMKEVALSVPTAYEFLGPGEISSGVALIRHISKYPCFVSVIGEFGLRMERMSALNANSAEISLRSTILNLYNKSGHNQSYRAHAYADKDKNTPTFESPSFTLLGESTPERFYEILNERMITEGMLSRFMLIEYTGDRPSQSQTFLDIKPSSELITKLSDLVASCQSIMHNKKCTNVQFSNEAKELDYKFDKYVDGEHRSSPNEVLRELWTRAHVKAMKIAALIAVGINPSFPVISASDYLWAASAVEHDIKALSTKFENGEIGKANEESEQDKKLLLHTIEFFTKSWEQIKAYCPSSYALYKMNLIPKEYLQKRTARMAVFGNDKRGRNVALDMSIKRMIEQGKIIDYTKHQGYVKLATTKVIYMPTDELKYDFETDSKN